MSVACSFSFNIVAWHAVSDKISNLTQWQAWSQNEAVINHFPIYQPELAFLPAIQRRRLGKVARLVCDATWELAERFSGSPVVYCSHDGEQNRSFDLWLEWFRSGSVSPTSFGLSVHNAVIGQWSMLRGDMNENTALVSGSDTLETALAEAYSLLQDGAQTVLLVLADEPLPQTYAVSAQSAPFPYAVAMVLTQGNDYHISLLHTENTPNGCGKSYWGSLDWVRFMLSGSLNHTQDYGCRVWQWQKNS